MTSPIESQIAALNAAEIALVAARATGDAAAIDAAEAIHAAALDVAIKAMHAAFNESI